jgi:hypothetical protein
MFRNFGRIFLSLASLASMSVAAGAEPAKLGSKRKRPLEISVQSWGPNQKQAETAARRVENSPEVRQVLQGTRYRRLSFDYIDSETKNAPSAPPRRFRLIFYDYTNDRTLSAESDFAGGPVAVREEAFSPVPNDDEFNEAVSIVRQDNRFAPRLADNSLTTFQPMPPTTMLDGSVERLVNVGLRVANSEQNEVVSVSIKRGQVLTYEAKAPPQSKAAAAACGVASANQSTSSPGLAGQYQLTVSDGQNVLWEMLIIRPSGSSGTNRSGIEIRDVKYRGKSVLKRGHVPILNVQYTPGSCGPYRDWQWQEDMFVTPASVPEEPAGFKIIPPGQIAETVLETGNDFGNFKGVAVYQQDVGNGIEVVMVSELQAGWYRYLSEWRFGTDGTIRPRYGFGATISSCVCDLHVHHAYWRFDFDIVDANNKAFMLERGRRYLKRLDTETTFFKNIGTNRSLLIQHATGDEAYMLVPNKTDGVVDTFGVSDFWLLRYKSVIGGTPLQNEIDDGETCINCTNTTAPIRIDPFINGESLVGQDIVVWYGAHFVHNDGGNRLNPERAPEVLTGTHVIGPDLRPVRW